MMDPNTIIFHTAAELFKSGCPLGRFQLLLPDRHDEPAALRRLGEIRKNSPKVWVRCPAAIGSGGQSPWKKGRMRTVCDLPLQNVTPLL